MYEESLNYEKYKTAVPLPEEIRLCYVSADLRRGPKKKAWQPGGNGPEPDSVDSGKEGFEAYYAGVCADYMSENTGNPGEADRLFSLAGYYLEKAAGAGIVDAFYRLGLHYRRKFSKTDMDRAFSWMEKGERAGSLSAKAALALKSFYSPDQKESRQTDMDRALMTVWQEYPTGDGIFSIRQIMRRPLSFYKAYGLIGDGCALRLSEHPKLKAIEALPEEEKERRTEQIRMGAVRLYQDLLLYYFMELSEDRNFEACRQLFSARYQDGYDDFRQLMLGILYLRAGSTERMDYVMAAGAIFNGLKARGSALGTLLYEAYLSWRHLNTAGAFSHKEPVAYACVQELAEAGNAEAQYWLGDEKYRRGEYNEAWFLLNEAWNNRCIPAGSRLGSMYLKGDFVLQDRERAFAYLLISARTNTREVYGGLGDYNAGAEPEKRKLARECYKIAAEKLDDHSMYCYGGILIADGSQSEREEGIRWLTQAGEMGNVDAMIALGILYEGEPGQNLCRAEEAFKKAASSGRSDALRYYGKFLVQSQKDSEKKHWGVTFLTRAAQQGDKEAQYQLAVCYGKGIGVAKNKKRMFEWMKRAAMQGHTEANRRMRKLYNGLAD